MKTIGLLILCLASCLTTGGCGYLAFLTAPEPIEQIPAECPDLEGHTVAMVIYADPDVMFEYPMAKIELSVMLNQQLADNAKTIKVLAPEKVIKYQAENVNWDTMDKTRLGSVLGVDYVLFISLMEFSTREPGSVNLFRGKITAEASVYKCSLPERRARIWHTERIEAKFPQEAPVAGFGGNEGPIRVRTEADFCKKLARKFYKHEINTEEEAKAQRSDFAAPGGVGNI